MGVGGGGGVEVQRKREIYGANCNTSQPGFSDYGLELKIRNEQ